MTDRTTPSPFEGLPDRLDELRDLISARLDADGNCAEDKDGDDTCLILWAMMEIMRLRDRDAAARKLLFEWAEIEDEEAVAP